MIYLHKSYSAVFSPAPNEEGRAHGHAARGTVRVHDPDAISLEETAEEPARLKNGTWRISCTPECEAHLLKHIQFSGASEKAIPLTGDEEREAQVESQRSQVQVAQMARALDQVIRAGAASTA